MATSFSPFTAPAPIASVGDAQSLITHFVEVMEALIGIVQNETDLVRAGRLSAATKLAQPKADLARLYITDTLRLRASQANLKRLLPAEKRDDLHRRHDIFRALLQVGCNDHRHLRRRHQHCHQHLQ